MTEISLDSQKDVQFLKSNISLATREKLDTHLPPSAVPNIHSDTLRKRVEEMLDEVPIFPTQQRLIVVRESDIRTSKFITSHKRNEALIILFNRTTRYVLILSIVNGLTDLDIEPFDAELLARVQSLHQEIERQILNITSARRSKPLEAAAIIQQYYSTTAELSPLPEIAVETPAPPIAIPREDEIKETFTNGMKVLKDLKKFVPATSAKVERAKEVVNHVYS